LPLPPMLYFRHFHCRRRLFSAAPAIDDAATPRYAAAPLPLLMLEDCLCR